MFLKNCWYVAAWDHELIDGKMLARTILEEAVLLYKTGKMQTTSQSVTIEDAQRDKPGGLFNQTVTTLAQVATLLLFSSNQAEGSAKLRGPSGCLLRPTQKVYVTGKQIRSVRFLLDGKTLRTVTKRDKAGRYAVTITRSKMTPGTHRVHAVVTFTTASKTKQRTLQLRFSRCGEVKPSRARGFTG